MDAKLACILFCSLLIEISYADHRKYEWEHYPQENRWKRQAWDDVVDEWDSLTEDDDPFFPQGPDNSHEILDDAAIADIHIDSGDSKPYFPNGTLVEEVEETVEFVPTNGNHLPGRRLKRNVDFDDFSYVREAGFIPGKGAFPEEVQKWKDIIERMDTRGRGLDNFVDVDQDLVESETVLKPSDFGALWYQRNKVRGLVPVPYYISRAFESWQKDVIRTAMNHIQQHSCIDFYMKDWKPDVMFIGKGDGCHANMYRKSTQRYSRARRRWERYQKVVIGDGCFNKNEQTPIHELLHALGFIHEHMRPDRNTYVTVRWENIINGRANQFHRFPRHAVNTFGYSYDFISIMHYSNTAFSGRYYRWWNGRKYVNREKATIVVKARYSDHVNRINSGILGPKIRDNTMSLRDVAKLKRAYRCQKWAIGTGRWEVLSSDRSMPDTYPQVDPEPGKKSSWNKAPQSVQETNDADFDPEYYDVNT